MASIKKLFKRGGKIRVTEGEEDYIITEIVHRMFELHTFRNSVRRCIKKLGGIERAVNRDSTDSYTLILDTTMCSGDFMQILQRCRDENREVKI